MKKQFLLLVMIWPLSSLCLVNSASASWSFIKPMPTGRAWPAAAAGPDGIIYVIGGYDDTGDLNVLESYDPKSGQWTRLAPMPTARAALAAATGLDGRIYAIGGEGRLDRYLDTVEAYDPATN